VWNRLRVVPRGYISYQARSHQYCYYHHTIHIRLTQKLALQRGRRQKLLTQKQRDTIQISLCERTNMWCDTTVIIVRTTEFGCNVVGAANVTATIYHTSCHRPNTYKKIGRNRYPTAWPSYVLYLVRYSSQLFTLALGKVDKPGGITFRIWSDINHESKYKTGQNRLFRRKMESYILFSLQIHWQLD
jgi:hypothetical protein